MALKIPKPTETIKVIVRADDSLVWPSEEDDPEGEQADETWSSYLKTLDESLLSFAEGKLPTRFVLKKVLNYDQAQAVQNATTTMKKGGQVDIQSGYVFEEVRQALVDIENPDYLLLPDQIHFKRDSDGACSKEIMAGLVAINAHMDLFTARKNAVGETAPEAKKKSQL